MNPSPFLRNRFPGTSSALLSLLCAGLVIFGVAGFICFRQFESAKNTALNADNTAASLVATVLAEHEKASRGVLLSYADRLLLIKAVKEKDLAAVHSHMEGMKRNNPEIDLIFLTDQDATIWANYPVYPEAIGQNVSNRDWYRGVSARWKPYTSTVFQLIVGDKPLAVATAVPVLDAKGEVVGILGNSRRLDFMANTIQNTYLQPHTTVNVIDQKGQLLFSNKYSFRDKVTDYPLLPVVQQAIKGNEHLIEATEPYVGDGKSYLTQYPVEHVGWTVVFERRHEDILRSTYRDFFDIGAIAILLFSLAAFFVFYHRKVVLLRKTEELLLTEQKLRKSEEKYLKTFQSNPACVGLSRLSDGLIIEANEVMLNVLGYSKDEFIGHKMTELGIWTNLADRQHLLQALAAEGRSVNKEYWLRTKNGELLLCNHSAELIQIDDVPHIIFTFFDITERKRAEEALRESRAKLKAAFASMTEAIFIADAEGRLIDFNEGFVRYHRFKDREECSRTIADCPRYLDAYFQDGTPAPPEMWAMPRALRGETASDVEYMLRRKDTGETWWGSYNFAPIKDEDGRIVGAVVAGREITDRKQAEEQISRSQKTFAELVERSPFGTYVVDSQFRIAHDERLLARGRVPQRAARDRAPFRRGHAHPLARTRRRGNHRPLPPHPRHRRAVLLAALHQPAPRRGNRRILRVGTASHDAAGRAIRRHLLLLRFHEAARGRGGGAQSEERLRFALESCQIGAWDIDLEDHTAYRSLEHDRIFGYQELLPQWTLDDFLKHALPEYRAPVETMVREATAAKTGWTYECQIRRADGEVRWIWFSGQHRTDSSGRSRVAGVVQDITERKRAEEALRESERVIGAEGPRTDSGSSDSHRATRKEPP